MYSIGIDFGTLAVRGLLLDIHTGKEVAVSEFKYPHGVMESNLPTGECLEIGWALQHPMDYIEGLVYVVKEVRAKAGIPADEIVGIGVDFTSSTVIPVDKEGVPLCCNCGLYILWLHPRWLGGFLASNLDTENSGGNSKT